MIISHDNTSSDEEVYGSDSNFIDNKDKKRFLIDTDFIDNDYDDNGIEHNQNKYRGSSASVTPDLEEYETLSNYTVLTRNHNRPLYDNKPLFLYNDKDVGDDDDESEFNDDFNKFIDDDYDYEYEYDKDKPEIDTSKDVISQISDVFHQNFQPNKQLITFTNNELPKEIRKYCNIIKDADIDFTTDLPLHLFTVYLLNTRNKNLPLPKFTLWPLPTHELIPSRSYLKTTNFESLGCNANDINKELDKSRFTYVNYEANSKLLNSAPHMWEFWHPKINPLEELNECLDSIFERRINSQILKFSSDHEYTKRYYLSDYTYQRHSPEDIQLDNIFKSKIKKKLDSIVDKLTDFHTSSIIKTSSLSRKLGTIDKRNNKKAKVVNFGLDWLSVLSCIDSKDKQSKLTLLKLFNLKLDKDIIHGPVNSYPIENEIYNDTKVYRDKLAKQLLTKNKSKSKVSRNTEYGKILKKRKSNIRYNLDSFMNLTFYQCKNRRVGKNIENKLKTENLEKEDGEMEIQ